MNSKQIIFFLCSLTFYLPFTNIYSQNTLKVGTSAVFSGASQKLGNNYYNGAKLYFDHVNSTGGINGKQIQMVKLDDGYNPEPCIKNTIKLIVEEKVDLLFNYVGTPTTTAMLPLLKIYEKENIVLFGNFTGAGGQRNYPYKQYVFNMRASYKEETAAIVEFFVKEKGYQRIGIYYQIDGYGRSGYDGVKQKLEAFGKTIAAEATYIRGTKYEDSIEVQAKHFKEKNVDAVICVGSYQACAAFVRDARKVKLEAAIANISFVGTEALLEILKTNNVSLRKLFFSVVVPHYGEDELPIIKEYKDLLQQTGEQPNFISLEGFINAKVLVKVLEQSPPQNLIRKNIKNIIETMKPIEIGLKKELQFSKSVHQLFHEVYMYEVDSAGNLKLATN